jgi:hypothetical protein
VDGSFRLIKNGAQHGARLRSRQRDRTGGCSSSSAHHWLVGLSARFSGAARRFAPLTALLPARARAHKPQPPPKKKNSTQHPSTRTACTACCLLPGTAPGHAGPGPGPGRGASRKFRKAQVAWRGLRLPSSKFQVPSACSRLPLATVPHNPRPKALLGLYCSLFQANTAVTSSTRHPADTTQQQLLQWLPAPRLSVILGDRTAAFFNPLCCPPQ